MTTISPAETMESRADVASRPLLLVGVVAGVADAASTTLVAVAAKALDVPLEAAPRNADAGKEIPMSGFATGIYRARTEPLGELEAWVAGLRTTWDQRFDALETEVHRTRRQRERLEERATRSTLPSKEQSA